MFKGTHLKHTLVSYVIKPKQVSLLGPLSHGYDFFTESSPTNYKISL